MAVVVELIVGELELVEGDHLLHPLGALGGTVGMDVDPRGGVWVRLAGHHPVGGVECISGIDIDDYNITYRPPVSFII